MVPIFAYGPGAENFTGIMENTDIAKKNHEIDGLINAHKASFIKNYE